MVLPLASGVRVSTRSRSRSRCGAVWRWARCMRRGTGAVRLTVQALQLTALLLGSLSCLLLLSSLRSLLLLSSLRSLLLLSSLRRLLLLGSLRRLLLLSSLRSLLLGLLLLVSLSLSLLGLLLGLLGLLLPRKPLLRSAQPFLIWARLCGRRLGRLIRLWSRRCLSARPLLLRILR